MLRMYDFKCEQNHLREALVEETIKELPCDVCDEKATRIISPTTIYLDPISGNHPSATAKWARQRAEKLAVERKKNS